MITFKNTFNIHFSHRSFEKLSRQFDTVGYLGLPEQSVEGYLSFASAVIQKHIVVIGIGGSSLGSKAINHFLKSHHKNEKTLHFLESTDPITLTSRLEMIDLDDALFLVISKSGSTIETMAIFKYILSLKPLSSEHYVIVTDEGSPLESFAISNNLRTFLIPSNVGGRFSVFSAVGLLPLALVGHDIKKLLGGAKKIKDGFFGRTEIYASLMTKATHFAQSMTHENINVVFSYAEIFRHFNEWYVQLWGESLGKKQRHSECSVGLTPVGLIGPTDQHSFLQLIVEGQRDKTVTFVMIDDFKNDTMIPAVNLEGLSSQELLNNISFGQLINMQAASIIMQLENLGITTDIITLSSPNEENIGALMYSYELLTSLVGEMLDVNTYDQPGVEEGKIILKENLRELQA